MCLSLVIRSEAEACARRRSRGLREVPLENVKLAKPVCAAHSMTEANRSAASQSV